MLIIGIHRSTDRFTGLGTPKMQLIEPLRTLPFFVRQVDLTQRMHISGALPKEKAVTCSRIGAMKARWAAIEQGRRFYLCGEAFYAVAWLIIRRVHFTNSNHIRRLRYGFTIFLQDQRLILAC